MDNDFYLIVSVLGSALPDGSCIFLPVSPGRKQRMSSLLYPRGQGRKMQMPSGGMNPSMKLLNISYIPLYGVSDVAHI